MGKPRLAHLVLPFAPLVAGLAGFAGCTLLNPLDGYSGAATEAGSDSPLPVVDAPTASSPPVEAGPPDAGCVVARPAQRPKASTNPGSTTIVAALSSFTFGDAKDPSKPIAGGYDIDGLCTCPGPRACNPGNAAGVCDLANGADNAFGEFWLIVESVLGASGSVSSHVSMGDEGLLVRIKNYNDEPDDDLVEVGLFGTFGAEKRQDGGAGTLKRDGTDVWTVDAKSLLGGTPYLPVAVDNRAYVAGGIVIAEVKFPIRVGGVTFPLVQGYFTAKLVKKAGGYGFEGGILTGRFPAARFLTGLESIATGPANYLCGTDPIYQSVRDGVCRVRDLPTDPTTDGREGVCDAVSVTIGFDADPAVLGRVVTTPPPARPCGGSWVATCP